MRCPFGILFRESEMSVLSLLRGWGKRVGVRQRRGLRGVEALEGRTLLTAYVVTTLSDSTAVDGLISLREAINASNTNAVNGDAPAGSATEQDTISFLKTLITGGPLTLTIATSRFSITSELKITGPGADRLTIDANGTGEIFNVNNAGVAEISGLTLTGGTGFAFGNGSTAGGAIKSSGVLTLRDCVITGNHAEEGGGIDAAGEVTLIGCTIHNNNATGGDGGGLDLGGSVLIINSTISGNSATGNGGGVTFGDNSGTLGTIINSTITLNLAAGGGGVHRGSGTVTLHNTIVAGNTQLTGALPNDLDGAVFGSDNLIGDAATAGGLSNGVNGNFVGLNGAGNRPLNTIINPTLADNGGRTLTHALAAGSVALDAGIDTRATIDGNIGSAPLTTDQRGGTFDRISGARVDIGAFEEKRRDDVISYDPVTGRWRLGISDGGAFSNTLGPLFNNSVGFDTFTGDFNGDALTDLAGRTDAGQWFVALNDGDNTFTTSNFGTWASDAAAGWTNVQVLDVNGDRKDDIVGLDNTRKFFVAVSDGTAFTTTQFGSALGTGFIAHIVGDYNGDGNDDIANLHNSGAWFVSESNGTTFVIDNYGSIASDAERDWRNFFSGDFNGDQVDDVLLQDQLGNWFIGDGRTDADGRFTVHFANRFDPNGFAEFFIGEFTGDGRDDLIGRTPTNAWLVNRSLENGRMTVKFWGSSGAANTVTATIGDFNGDGLTDVAALVHSTNTWFTLISNAALLEFTTDPFGTWTGWTGGIIRTGRINQG
jgi:hypothetical protein